ncbi:hypothetical protein A3860_21090 [Niastella vici]|uniref:Uncharacterized protein n=1 Tax=Niastella vici TaxID=1703345 RepID=A0A1V9G1X4_9BACT|nr:hypothetical protein [Niastella vici]OQP64466.1 hypothetical protein A3860_21090 [Niastella vici]
MAKESLIASAMETAGLSAAGKLAEKGVTKAIRTLPKGKQRKVAGAIVFVAAVVFLLFASKRWRTPVE